MIGVSFLLILVFLLIYLPSIIETQDWLNYSSVAKLYDGETVNVIYNSNYQDGSPNSIAESIVSGQGSSINPTAVDLKIGAGEDYTTFLEGISTQLNTKGGDMAAYYIEADQSTKGDWDINAVIFANATSPASVPVFGNLLLQSIAQTVSGDDQLKLEFEYTAYEQSVMM